MVDLELSPSLHPKKKQKKTPPPFSLKAVAPVGPLGSLAPNLGPEKKAAEKALVCAYLMFGNEANP